MTSLNLLHRARALYASGPKGDGPGQGVVVAYTDAPMYLIRCDDGSQFWWRADLTEIGDRIDPADLPEREDWQEAQP